MSEDELPSLVSTIKIGGGAEKKWSSPNLFDAKFYPFTPPGVDPVFAVTGGPHTIVCRPCLSSDQGIEFLQWFRDEDERVELNSLAWTQDPATGDPLICVTGNVPKIKILNVRTGELVRTLAGHGSNINELAISPLSKQILVSASEDYSVRLWYLDPAFQKQPTAAIFAGDGGHSDGLMSLAFHPSGKYLISGGMDTRINLWGVPHIPNDRTGTDRPNFFHFPYFTTTEVHSDIVDCIEWYGDLVLSKSAKENRILLWRIKGFSSSRPVPGPDVYLPAKKTPHPETRSAFGAGWQQLLAFDIPGCKEFYNRFGLFHMPSQRPVVAHATLNGRMLFWDLQRLEDGVPGTAEGRNTRKRRRKAGGGTIDSNPSDTGSLEPLSKSSNGTPDLEPEKGAESLDTPFKKQKPHKSIPLKDLKTANQCSWSRGGEWCVAVGGDGTMCLFRRWVEGRPKPTGQNFGRFTLEPS